MDVIYNPPTARHYVAAVLIPPYALLAGLLAMARSMVGPGIALWVTGLLGFWFVWPVIILILANVTE